MTTGDMIEEIYGATVKGKGLTYLKSITGNGSVNIASIRLDYKSLTANNFLLVLEKVHLRLYDGNTSINSAPGKSYNASSGILTISNISGASSSSYMNLTVGIYLKI